MPPLSDDGPPREWPPIIQYWHEETPPDYVKELLATFRGQNPGFRHLVFSESSAESFIEEHLGGREARAFRACAVPAMQADYLRYCATLALGGIYCDVDEQCMASLRPLLAPDIDGQLFIRPEGAVINGFFAFGSPGHPFLELALEIASDNIEGRRGDQVYFTTGPPIFTCLYWLHRLGSLDALLDRAAGTGFEEHFSTYCETIGDPQRAKQALSGVRVSPFAESRAFLRESPSPLPYKSMTTHWTKFDQDIFRGSSNIGGTPL